MWGAEIVAPYPAHPDPIQQDSSCKETGASNCVVVFNFKPINQDMSTTVELTSALTSKCFSTKSLQTDTKNQQKSGTHLWPEVHHCMAIHLQEQTASGQFWTWQLLPLVMRECHVLQHPNPQILHVRFLDPIFTLIWLLVVSQSQPTSDPFSEVLLLRPLYPTMKFT